MLVALLRIGEIARETLKHDFRSIDPKQARILLLDGAPRLLTTLPEDLSKEAEKSLLQLGVRVRAGAMVNQIDGEGVTYRKPDGSM